MSEETPKELARALLNLADTAGMPDTYWETDWRTTMARNVLDVPRDGRYSHAHLWDTNQPDAMSNG